MLSRFAVAVLMCWTLGAPALLGATQDLDQEQEVLPLPVLLDAELALGASRVHRVRAVHAGLVTLSLESFDFNPSFDILDADGSAVLGDTDSGLMFNARRVVQVEAGERFDVRVQSENALGGTYRLDIQHGEVPLPTGRTARRAEAELYAAYGHQSRSTADGDPQKRSTSLQWFLAAANVEFELQRSGRAKRLLEIVIPLADELGDQGSGVLGRLLLGGANYRLGHGQAAVELLEPLLPVVAGNPELESFARGYLGSAYASVGRSAEGRELLHELLQFSTDQGHQLNAASAHRRLGLLERAAGQIARGREHLEQSVELWRLGADVSGEAGVLLDLASLQEAAGKQSEAMDACRAVLLMDVSKDVLVRARSVLAEILFKSGRPVEARTEFRAALNDALAAGLTRAQQNIQLQLAVIAVRLKDVAVALELLDAILAGDSSPEYRAAALLEQGLLMGKVGDMERATDNVGQSIAIFHEQEDVGNELRALSNRGFLLAEAGRFDEARKDAQQALALIADDVTMLPTGLHNAGYVELLAGEYTRAHALGERAVAASRHVGDERLLILALGLVADASLGLGKLAQAERALGEASTLVDWGGGIGERTAVQRQTSGWLAESTQELTALRLESASEPGERAEILRLGFLDAGRWKGRQLLEGIVQLRLGLRTAESEALRLRLNEARADREAVLEALSDSFGSFENPEQIRDLRQRVGELGKRVKQLEQQWRMEAPRDAALEIPVGSDPDEVASVVLKPTDLLVEFVQGDKAIYAYVVSKAGARFLELGDRSTLEAGISSFIEAISDPTLSGGADRIATLGQPLYESLLEPALQAAELDGRDAASGPELSVRRLIIVPVGALTSLPFEALVMERPTLAPKSFEELRFVLDDYEVVYGPSSAILVELASRSGRVGGEAKSGEVLLLADPDYGGATDVSGQAVQRLLGTRSEARAILGTLDSTTDWEALFEGERSFSKRGAGVELHVGSEAHAGRLSGDLRRFDVIHLAAHGRVDRNDVRRTALVLAADPSGGHELPVGDVLSLLLDARLTVLSACNSARGVEQRGEGVQSLTRAFLYAGSRAVVASLWTVNDIETARMMAGLYDQMAEGVATARALRLAKLALRRGRLRVAGSTVRGGSLTRPAPIEEGDTVERGGSLGNPLHPTDATTGHPYLWAPFIHVGLPD